MAKLLNVAERRARIIATLGPASSSESTIRALLKAGVNVFRLNMSHGTRPEHRERIRIIRQVAGELGLSPAVLMDLQGPKIRVGVLGQPRPLKQGSLVTLACTRGDPECIPVTYAKLHLDVKPGCRILIEDGRMELRVETIRNHRVMARVLRGGLLRSGKGINLPDTQVSVPALTPKDRTDVEWGLRHGVDYIALSFVRRSHDLIQLRRILERHKSDVPIIAKIEKPQAANDLDSILNVSDGVMVARGDLGVEMSPQSVPVLQKCILRAATCKARISITATQMLESMIENSQPTRAEASDVANAIFDGSDAVMLSAETATGKYPVECVRTMDAIIREAEGSDFAFRTGGDLDGRSGVFGHMLAESAFHAAGELDRCLIAVFTMSGATAQYLAKLRPPARIVALTPSEAVRRRLSLVWGVETARCPFGRNSDLMIENGEKALLRLGLARRGDVLIIVAGTTPTKGGTNMIKIHRL